MALIVGGTTVTGTQTLEASTLTGTASAINGSNITNLPAPSNAQIIAGYAACEFNDVGNTAFLYRSSGTPTNRANSTLAGSSLLATNANGTSPGSNTNPSGTWRCMGTISNNSASEYATVWLRSS
jgi:hypothetical protein|tara:strand:+ start:119 stop:493 length:375 start_codon:yes stop_codon:yes gene_type:complete